MNSDSHLIASSYRCENDLYRAQAALMQWVHNAGHCNYLHKGDVGHRVFNNCYEFDKSDVFRLWTDATGEVRAFAMLSPHREFFDLQVAPDLLCSDDHVAIFESCERETLRLGEKYGKAINAIEVEGCDCDPLHTAFIEARGYRRDYHSLSLTRHDLGDLPEANLPAGFRFHQATSADAEQMADMHNHSFSSKWNAESYGEVFRSPHMEYELVVVAPDGRFAAFTNVWIDAVNRSLYFEPVGTHSDFRRRGIAKALMIHALRRMQAEHGIECAYVCHEPRAKNPASCALYASVGFKEFYDIYQYSRRL